MLQPNSVSPLINAKTCAAKVNGGVSTWYRRHSAKEVPEAIKFGGKTFWYLAEIDTWIRCGMPIRKTWERMWDRENQRLRSDSN